MEKSIKHLRAKGILLLPVILFCSLSGCAQALQVYGHVSTSSGSAGNDKKERDSPPAIIKPLKVGDEVPEMTFSMVNYEKDIVKLSEFKGKLVILDFWATWCTSCINYFPKMDTLQKLFNGDLQVVLVNSLRTKDDKEKVKAFFDRWEKRKGERLGLPTAVYDTIADQSFVHLSVPHYVWIDENQHVLAVTGAEEVTKEKIKAVLENREPVKFKQKIDRWYNMEKPLFSDGNGGEGGDMKYRSLITGYTAELGGSSGWNKNRDNRVSKIFGINVSALMLYLQAFPDAYGFPENRILLKVSDSLRFHKKGSWEENDWKYKNLYCYELIVPPTTPERIHKIMQNDLIRYFGAEAGLEKVKTKCLVLKSSSNVKKAFANGGAAESTLEEKDNAPKYIRNYPLSVVIHKLNQLLSLPVLDESNVKEKLNLTLPANLKEISALKQAFEKQGFILVEEERMIEMFVIKELE